jgi:hypothetical protein
MPTTFQKIASVTAGSGGAANIEFTSIPQTYTDLVVKLTSRISTSASRDVLELTFNASTSGYSFSRIYGYDSNLTGTDSASSQAYILFGNTTANTATSNTFGNHEIFIPNYTGNGLKSTSSSAMAENNSSSAWQISLVAGLWASTSAITSLKITPSSGSLMQHSTATLYGIKNS